MSRELTREEKRSIRKLVFSLCANYDREYGCLPLDGPCYMLGKCWTGHLVFGGSFKRRSLSSYVNALYCFNALFLSNFARKSQVFAVVSF